MRIASWQHLGPFNTGDVVVDLSDGEQITVGGFDWHRWQLEWSIAGLLPEIGSLYALDLSFVDGPGSSLVPVQ